MDIISYGAASKAASTEKNTRNKTLGTGVEGHYINVKERIDHIEKAFAGITKQADRLIVNDSINIMKANAKLNTVAKSMKYKMHNMIFDGLLDLSGIDTDLSSGYTHSALEGSIENGIIITTTEVVDVIPNKAILMIEEYIEKLISCFISRDDGQTWEPITPNELFYFDDNISPLDNKIRLKAELPNGTKLLNYGLTWS